MTSVRQQGYFLLWCNLFFVSSRWEKVLSPLESACEDVKRKTNELLKAVHLQPPDVRMLQVNLQGAVLTAVNQVCIYV